MHNGRQYGGNMPILNEGSTSSVFVLAFDKKKSYLTDYLSNKINKHA
jgi:hypothetical protein